MAKKPNNPRVSPPPTQANSARRFSEFVPVFWLLLVLLLVCVIRLRLLAMPLERDEGEFAYVGQLMLDGIAPFKLAYVIKLPGTYALYALIMAVFGQTASAIHAGLLLANVGATVATFFLGKKLFDTRVGVIAAISFALLALGEGTVGLASHATQFIILFVLCGFLLLFQAMEKAAPWKFFLTGLLFGIAFILKQPGIVFAALAGMVLLANGRQQRIPWQILLRRALVLSTGVILPYAVMCALLWHAGVFKKFWFWTVTCAGGRWLSWRDTSEVLAFYFKTYISQTVFWCAAAIGFVLLLRSRIALPRKIFLAAFASFSIVAVVPGFQFREHYFVLLLPALGLLVGVAVTEVADKFSRASLPKPIRCAPIAVFAAICLFAIFSERKTFFQLTPREVVQHWYQGNPFCEAVDVGTYLKDHSASSDKIAVLGSEPEVYFYSHRHSATGHMSTYILMEDHPYSDGMQQEMIGEISAAMPSFLVVATTQGSWLQKEKSGTRILEWIPQFTEKYNLVGVVDLRAESPPHVRWGADAQSEDTPKTGLLVYQRK